MKHLVKKHISQCMLYSFAMVLDVEPDYIIELLGHDGTEIFWPELREPKCYKGFHITEMAYTCYRFYHTCYEFPSALSLGHSDDTEKYIHPIFSINGIISSNNGVFITPNHALAWDAANQKILDPNGTERKLSDINWDFFYLVQPLIVPF